MSDNSKISRDDIKNRLVEIQDEAVNTADEAKNQIIVIGAGIGLLLLFLAFFFGRRAGKRKSTVIEVRRT